jgi:hypothetical protein
VVEGLPAFLLVIWRVGELQISSVVSGLQSDRRSRHMHQLLTRELLRLVDQSAWANLRWVEFVFSQPDPEVRPRELLSHIMLGERVWFERIENQERMTTTFPLRSKEELLRGFSERSGLAYFYPAGRRGSASHVVG